MSAPARNPQEPELKTAEVAAEPPKKNVAPIIMGVIALVALVYGVNSWWSGRNYEGTDDAYVTADIVQVDSAVKGTLVGLKIQDNERVKAGQEIATIEPDQYEINLQQAKANLAIAQAQADSAGVDVELTRQTGDAQIQGAQGGAAAAGGSLGAATAQIGVLQAQLQSARASQQVATSEIDNLSKEIENAGDAVAKAVAQVRSAQAALITARAGAKAAQAGVNAANSNLELVKKQFARAQALLGDGAISQREFDQARNALDSATAGLEQAQRQQESAVSAIEQRESDIQTAQAGERAARTALDQAKLRKTQGFDRLRSAEAGVAAQRATVEAARQAANTARGSLMQAQAGVASAQTLPEKLRQKDAQKALALAQVQQAKVAVANAELDLKRTHVLAPTDGIVSKRYALIGNLMQNGSPVASIVPVNNLYIVANFKETQVARMRAGQEVEVDIDGFGGHKFHGKLDSLSAATGSQFALIPPDNATGNFVKVVQRVPVKVVLTADEMTPRLAAGMSAAIKVKVLD